MIKRFLLILFLVLWPFQCFGAIYTNDADLLALYRMEETSGTRYDTTTHNEDLTDNNTVGYEVDNKSVGSGDVNSADFILANTEWLSRINANLSSDFPGKSTNMDGGSGGFSVVMWIKQDLTSESSHQYLISKGDEGWTIASAYNEFKWAIYDGTDYNINWYGSESLGNWIHLAMTWAGDTTDEMICYVNGSADTADTVTAVNANTSDFQVGGEAGSNPGAEFDGNIDEVAVFKRALSSSEISDIYSNGIQDPVAEGAPQVIIIISWLKNECHKLRRAWRYGILWSYIVNRIGIW